MTQQTYNIAARREVFNRSLPATVSFCVLAVIIFAAQSRQGLADTEDYIFLALILFANLGRAWVYLLWRGQEAVNPAQWSAYYLATFVNSLGWGLACFHVASHAQTSPLILALTMIIAVGLINAAIYTLGLDTLLMTTFVLITAVPFAVSFFYQYNQTSDANALAIACILVLAIVYVLFQARLSRLRFAEKLKADDDLMQSQNALLEQRALTEHARRLASMGEMAAGFAHEINNPLAIVTGHLELLSTQASADPKHVEKALAATRRISRIVKNLRSLSHHSSDDQKTHNSSEALLRETVEMFTHRLEGHNVRFDLTLEDASLYCDAVQISQVLLNLLNNAFDAVETLPPEERWIELKAFERTPHFIVEVRNGGPAISAELCDKIFTPFFTTKPVGQGQGLGLAISRTISIRHHGELTVGVSEGHTAFVLQLPLAPREL